MNKDLEKELIQTLDVINNEGVISLDNEEFAYSREIRMEMQQYVVEHGYYHNARCGWTNEKIFAFIDAMNLYEKSTKRLINTNYVCNNPQRSLRNYSRTSAWASLVGHAIPTASAINFLAKILRSKKTLSVGCSIAIWEYMLQNLGCNVTCVDIFVHPFTYTHVVQMDCLNPSDFQKETYYCNVDVLFLGWPEPNFDCTCCKWCKSCFPTRASRIGKNKYCVNGYDYQVLKDIMPNMVIALVNYVEFTCKCNSEVLSKSAYQLIRTHYTMVKRIRLPYEEDDDYIPVVEIWKKNL